jgi:hypothetical protein
MNNPFSHCGYRNDADPAPPPAKAEALRYVRQEPACSLNNIRWFMAASSFRNTKTREHLFP